MKGWKTYVGAAIVAAAAVLHFLDMGGLADALFMVGAALGFTGLRAKFERMAPGK